MYVFLVSKTSPYFVGVVNIPIPAYCYSLENSGNLCKALCTCVCSVCSACVRELLFNVFMFRVTFYTNTKPALCVCIYLCVCVRSPGARGCVKYNCCVRKWKVSICQSGGTDETKLSLHCGTSCHSNLWTNDQFPFLNMWRCGVMMSGLALILKRQFKMYYQEPLLIWCNSSGSEKLYIASVLSWHFNPYSQIAGSRKKAAQVWYWWLKSINNKQCCSYKKMMIEVYTT